MSEVSGFHHGIDTQSGMMTKSMVEKKYLKTLVVLVGGRGWKEEWRVYGLYSAPMKGNVIWVMEKKSENLGHEI